MVDLATVITIRNMDRYIKEWIDFHLIVGVQKFFIYDIESSAEDTTQDILQPYIKHNIVSYAKISSIDDVVPRGVLNAGHPRPQWWFERANVFLRYKTMEKHKHDIRWMMLTDIDEFTFPTDSNKKLTDILTNYEQFNALCVNWTVFGTSNIKKYYPGYVIDKFSMRAPMSVCTNEHYKTICQLSKVNYEKYCHVPHLVYYKDRKAGVTEDGIWIGSSRGVPYIKSPEKLNNVIRCNHYMYKSEEEYSDKMKLHKDQAKDRSVANQETLDLHNSESDTLIKRYTSDLQGIDLNDYLLPLSD